MSFLVWDKRATLEDDLHAFQGVSFSMGRNQFGYFDREREVQITSCDLPHWFQAGTAMFVTFRTADSMPAVAIERRQREIEYWLHGQRLPIELATTSITESVDSAKRNLSDTQFRAFKRIRDRLWHGELDRLHGDCVLRDPSLAGIVSESIRYFDGIKYDLDRLVVMPNHVHVIVQFYQDESLQVIAQSWLRFTARQINRAIGRSGPFWQGEPFDHLIRSPEQFQYLQRYIAENPKKANLNQGEYLYWES